jgi:hypothetical protein
MMVAAQKFAVRLIQNTQSTSLKHLVVLEIATPVYDYTSTGLTGQRSGTVANSR